MWREMRRASLPVEVRDYEPHEALFGGATGVEIYARLIAQAAGALRAGGVLVLELGYDSLAHVQALLARPDAAPDGAASGRNSRWSDIRVTNDLAGIPRVISATRSPRERNATLCIQGALPKRG